MLAAVFPGLFGACILVAAWFVASGALPELRSIACRVRLAAACLAEIVACAALALPVRPTAALFAFAAGQALAAFCLVLAGIAAKSLPQYCARCGAPTGRPRWDTQRSPLCGSTTASAVPAATSAAPGPGTAAP